MSAKQIILVLLLGLYFCSSFAQDYKQYRKDFVLMGSRFEIAIVSDNQQEAFNLIDTAYNEIVRIEKLISSWDVNSETTLINNGAGIKPVSVSKELFNLIRRSKKVSELSQGAFDISYASLDKVWKFDGTMKVIPDSNLVSKSVVNINYKLIELNENNTTVFLKKKGMRIGFGAIGKGYAANQVKSLLVSLGVKNAMINAGGDLIAWGEGINNEKWKVGIADPKKEKGIISWLEIANMAIVTSGNYEKFIEVDGVKYSHIIDPRTGYPVLGLKSVTIICPDAELADALATTVFVLGHQKGLALINQLKAIECVLISNDDEIITSNSLKLNIQ